MKNMSPNKIKNLLDKYLEGKTSLEDEKLLIAFFQSDEVPGELESFKAEFQHYAISALDEPGDIVQNAIDSLGIETKTQPRFYASGWYRIAATLLLVAVSFFLGYGFNIKGDLKEEVMVLKDQIIDLQETTVRVMLQGESSHQRIRALVMASKIESVTDGLLENVLATFDEDKSPIVREVALEFLGMYKESDRVKSILINSLMSQELLSIQIELLRIVQSLEDTELVDELEKLLNRDEVSLELKQEIRKVVTGEKAQNL